MLTLEPGVVLPLVIGAAWYARGVWIARRGSRRALPGSAIAAFVAGWVALVVALVSPLDPLAEQVFSAHMVQHLLLIVVAAPLIVVGGPPHVWLWALPLSWRRRLTRWWLRSHVARLVTGVVTNPPAVLVAHTAALWFWHFPRPYEAALRSEFLHALEHLSFFATALAFWWVVLHPVGRRTLGYGAAILYVGITLMQSGALGALLMFSWTAWYPVQAAGAAAYGMTPLEDQQLAGLIMWIPASAVYIATAAMLFLRWMQADERATRAIVAAGIVGVSIGCASGAKTGPANQVHGGDADRGKVAIASYGCAACHDIPGIRYAKGVVGPPLSAWASRGIIAGATPNTPDELVAWIMHPQMIQPGNVMPEMGVSTADARDIAAYLYSLK